MQLVLTVIGNQSPTLTADLTAACQECECNILEARHTLLANQIGVYMLLQGNWNHIAKLENTLDTMAQKFGWVVNYRRAESVQEDKDALPYAVDLFTRDRIGLLAELSEFFADRQIPIVDLACSRSLAAHTDTPLLSIHLTITVPANQRIISLRDEFLEFCDRSNFDAIFEPVKR